MSEVLLKRTFREGAAFRRGESLNGRQQERESARAGAREKERERARERERERESERAREREPTHAGWGVRKDRTHKVGLVLL